LTLRQRGAPQWIADTRWEGLNARARQVGLDLLELGGQALS